MSNILHPSNIVLHILQVSTIWWISWCYYLVSYCTPSLMLSQPARGNRPHVFKRLVFIRIIHVNYYHDYQVMASDSSKLTMYMYPTNMYCEPTFKMVTEQVKSDPKTKTFQNIHPLLIPDNISFHMQSSKCIQCCTSICISRPDSSHFHSICDLVDASSVVSVYLGLIYLLLIPDAG